MLVPVTAIALSNTVDIEWDFSRLAAFVIFPNGVRVPVVFHSNE